MGNSIASGLTGKSLRVCNGDIECGATTEPEDQALRVGKVWKAVAEALSSRRKIV
jgi:hypothetical protein